MLSHHHPWKFWLILGEFTSWFVHMTSFIPTMNHYCGMWFMRTSEEKYALIGGFNAHGGSAEVNGIRLVDVMGLGLSMMLERSQSIHLVTVCNTWFQKSIHRTTRQHPKSKQWSCIDYVIMIQFDTKVCWVFLLREVLSAILITTFWVLP